MISAWKKKNFNEYTYQFENQDGKKSQAIVMNSNIQPELCKRQCYRA